MFARQNTAALIALVSAAFLAGCGSHKKIERPLIAPENLILQDQPVVLPMRRIHGMAVIDAPPIDGQASMMIVDTGATMAYFSDRLLRAYGRESVYSTRTTDAAGSVRLDQSLVLIPSYSLGPVTFERFHAAPLEPTDLRRYLGQAFDGALGIGLFRDCLLTLDYPQRQVVLEIGALKPDGGREVLPTLLGIGPDAKIDVALAGQTVSASIDSGFEGAIELPRALADKLGWQVHGRTARFQNLNVRSSKTRGQLAGDLKIGDHIIPQPNLLVVDDGDQVTIGSHILQQFAVTFDQKSQFVRFTRVP